MALMVSLDDVMQVLKKEQYLFLYECDDAMNILRNELEQKSYILVERNQHAEYLKSMIEEVTDISNVAEQIRIGRLKDWLVIYRDNMIGSLELMLKDRGGKTDG